MGFHLVFQNSHKNRQNQMLNMGMTFFNRIVFNGIGSKALHFVQHVLKIHPRYALLDILGMTRSWHPRLENSTSQPQSIYLKYKEIKNCDKSTNSLTMVAGDCIPINGTMSTCNQLSTAEPTTAPATRPPIVITVAFPAEGRPGFSQQ